MKFETIKIELEKYESLDIITSSPSNPEDPTVAPTQPATQHDPYANDKW